MEQESDSGINETEDLSLFGYKFHPSDEELIYYALRRTIEGPLIGGVGSFFIEHDLYGVEPGEFLDGTVAGGSVYVFTMLKKKSKNGKRTDRTVAGKGTWKEKDKVKTFYGSKNQLIGWRKGFAYIPNSKSNFKDDDREYRMKEYSFPNSVLAHAKFTEYVLCKIKKLRQKEKNKDDAGGYLQQHQPLDSLALVMSADEPEHQQREIITTPMKLDNVGADHAISTIETHAAPPPTQYYPMPYHHLAPPPSTACQAEPKMKTLNEIEELLMNEVEESPATFGACQAEPKMKTLNEIEELLMNEAEESPATFGACQAEPKMKTLNEIEELLMNEVEESPATFGACQAEPKMKTFNEIEELLMNEVEESPATFGGYHHYGTTSMELYRCANSCLSTQELSPAATLPGSDPIFMPIDNYRNELAPAPQSFPSCPDVPLSWGSLGAASAGAALNTKKITLVQSSTTSWSDQLQTDQDHIHHHHPAEMLNDDFVLAESLAMSNPSSWPSLAAAEPQDYPSANLSFGQLFDEEAYMFDSSLDGPHAIEKLYAFVSQPLGDNDQEGALLPEEFTFSVTATC